MDNVNSDVANLISGKTFGYGILGLLRQSLMAWEPGIFPCYYKHDPPATFIGESFFREKVVCNRMLLFFCFLSF